MDNDVYTPVSSHMNLYAVIMRLYKTVLKIVGCETTCYICIFTKCPLCQRHCCMWQYFKYI